MPLCITSYISLLAGIEMEEMKIKQIYVAIPKMFKHSLTYCTELKQISSTHQEDLKVKRKKRSFVQFSKLKKSDPHSLVSVVCRTTRLLQPGVFQSVYMRRLH